MTVAAAIKEWESRPPTTELAEPDGPSATTLQDAIANAQRNLRRDRATVAANQARVTEVRLRRAETLSEAFRHRPPLYTAAEANLDQEAAEALAAWDAQPSQLESEGTPTAILEKRLAEITDQIAQIPAAQVRPRGLWMAAALGILLAVGLAVVTSLGFTGAAAAITVCGGSALWLGWRREQGRVRRTANRLAEFEAPTAHDRRSAPEPEARGRGTREEPGAEAGGGTPPETDCKRGPYRSGQRRVPRASPCSLAGESSEGAERAGEGDSALERTAVPPRRRLPRARADSHSRAEPGGGVLGRRVRAG